jgi:hypothetical protein
MKEGANNTSMWVNLLAKINLQKPDYGKLTVELSFHQRQLVKANLISRQETVIYEKGK